MNNRPFQGAALSALLVSRFESTGTCIFIGQGHIIRGWGVLIDYGLLMIDSLEKLGTGIGVEEDSFD